MKTPGHPLDSLSATEITAAAAVCKLYAESQGVENLRFNIISLQEPTKASLLAYEADNSAVPLRQAFCVLQSPPSYDVYEVLLTLAGYESPCVEQVTSWKKVVCNPIATPDDCFLAEEIAKADPEVKALLAERYGHTDMDLLVCDPWSIHACPLEGRLIQCFMYLKTSPNDNQYAHPIDMVPIVDLNLRKVVHIDRYPGKAPPVPMTDDNYHAELFPGQWRKDIKPLDVVQPEGPSFSVTGNLVSWQKWQFRVGFNYREGLVLHQLGYKEGEELRPVLHRASLVEMAVPYGDPREPYVRKCAFDVGDYGLGYCANSLSLGCDCLGHIHYFDAVMSNSRGEPYELKHAVCMHEEDYGLLWKHVEYRNGHNESRRSRRLVISSIATVVNYEYCFYWYLYQDGTISYEIKLTGELSTNLLSPGEDMPEHGTLVGEGINAQHHQHMFCARLDPAVDDPQGGKGLVVSEVDVEPMPAGPDNPYGNGFRTVETSLTSTHQAQRLADPFKGRVWKIKNPACLNPTSKQAVAYKLMPHAAPLLLAQPSSLISQKGYFATKNLWVTPHREEHKWPAGEYVLQAKDCTGLKQWTQEDQSLVDADPVIWYAFGVTHVVRPEDFPVMPCEYVGFHLKPFGFFARNPALDISPDVNKASKKCCANGMANGAANCAVNGMTNGVTNGATNGVANGCH